MRWSQPLDSVAPAGDAITMHVGGASITVDELLVATGRRPNTGSVGVETVGLEPGKPLAVDDTGLVEGVDGEWLYAAGRCHRPGPAHPPGQVPGANRRRRDRGALDRRGARHPAVG